MNKVLNILGISICSLVFALSAGAGDMDHSGHGMNMDHSGHAKNHDMDHSSHMGENIHNSTVDGYHFAYHLIDMQKKMAAMKGMKGMKMDMTHHLMVYVMGPDGKPIEGAKIGYLVKGPDNNNQKCMTMAMGTGFGADVNLKEKGMYSVTTKVVADGKKLVDTFEYHMN